MRCVSVKIELSRTIHPADGEYKKAAAEIAFAPDENATEINVGNALTTAFDFAQAHICERLGLTVKKITLEHPVPEDAPPGMAVDPAVAKKEAAAAKRKAKKAEKDAAALMKAAEEKPSAAAVTDDDEIPGFLKRDETPNEAKPPSAADIVDDENQTEIISDGELISTVSAKVAAMMEAGTKNAADIIKKSIGAFNPEPGTPFKIPNIPQEKRREFLATIELIG